MMYTSDLRKYLEGEFPGVKFYSGLINRNDSQCVGLYLRGAGKSPVAIGGIQNSSYAELPVSILVHWTENYDTCEKMASQLYEKLLGVCKIPMNNKMVVTVQLLDSHPIDVGRDTNNIVEMTIRVNIIYESEVM